VKFLEAAPVGQQVRAAIAERGAKPLAVKPPDGRIRDDEPPRSDAVTIEHGAEVVAEALPNQDGRGAGPGGDVNADGIDHSALDSGLSALGNQETDVGARPKPGRPRAQSREPEARELIG